MKKIDKIKMIVDKTYSSSFWSFLIDKALHQEYLNSPSTIAEAKTLDEVLAKNNVSKEKRKSIYKQYAHKLVKAGTKGVIRGKAMNKLIEKQVKFLLKKCNVSDQLIISTEKTHTQFSTDEKPDIVIEDKRTGKILIIMNQVDLWGGGQQTNRASKYLNLAKKYKKNKKFISVVAKKYCPVEENGKMVSIMHEALCHNYIVYTKQLDLVIKEFFKIC